MADPAVPACLNTPYSAKPTQRGGTIIAEDVADLEEHRRRLADPDRYRPTCECCGGKPHAHDFRERRVLADPKVGVIMIRRFRCRPCHAVWQVLPGLLARHLHRTWRVVLSAMVAAGVLVSGGEPRVTVPLRTVLRWSRRLMLSGAQLVQALVASGVALPDAVQMDGSRANLVDGLARAGDVALELRLAQVAGWIHRFVSGVRLM